MPMSFSGGAVNAVTVAVTCKSTHRLVDNPRAVDETQGVVVADPVT